MKKKEIKFISNRIINILNRNLNGEFEFHFEDNIVVFIGLCDDTSQIKVRFRFELFDILSEQQIRDKIVLQFLEHTKRDTVDGIE